MHGIRFSFLRKSINKKNFLDSSQSQCILLVEQSNSSNNSVACEENKITGIQKKCDFL